MISYLYLIDTRCKRCLIDFEHVNILKSHLMFDLCERSSSSTATNFLEWGRFQFDIINTINYSFVILLLSIFQSVLRVNNFNIKTILCFDQLKSNNFIDFIYP